MLSIVLLSYIKWRVIYSCKIQIKSNRLHTVSHKTGLCNKASGLKNSIFVHVAKGNLSYVAAVPTQGLTHACIHMATWESHGIWRPEKHCILAHSALIQCDRGLVSCYVHQRASRADSFHYKANKTQFTIIWCVCVGCLTSTRNIFWHIYTQMSLL